MLLEAKNIYFSYKDETIFSGFGFGIHRGEHVVFKGESGSGKSTLLKIILGFESPGKGTIYYKNHEPKTTDFKILRQNTAWLPQDLNLGNSTVEEIFQFPFSFQNNKSKEPDLDKIIGALEQLGLEKDVLEKQFNDLSTGQRQRVGLAFCHLLNRPLLLLDEPTSALDESSKMKAADLLLNGSNKTIISVSHDPFWLNKADRIIELNSN